MSVISRYLSDDRVARKRDEISRLDGQRAQALAEADSLLEVLRELGELMRSTDSEMRTCAALERLQIREEYQRAAGKAEKLGRECDAAKERLAIWNKLRRTK